MHIEEIKAIREQRERGGGDERGNTEVYNTIERYWDSLEIEGYIVLNRWHTTATNPQASVFFRQKQTDENAPGGGGGTACQHTAGSRKNLAWLRM